MQTRYLYMLRFVLAISDITLINFCFFISYHFTDQTGTAVSPAIYRHNIITSSIIWLLTTSIFGLYSKNTLFKLEYIYRATWKSVALHLLFFVLYLSFTEYTGFPKNFLLFFYPLMAASFLISRFAGTALEGVLMNYFNIRKAVAVLGMNSGGIKLAAYLEEQGSFNFMGFLDEKGLAVDHKGCLISAAADQFKNAAQMSVKEVFVSLTADRMQDVPHLLKEAEKHCIRLKFVPDLNYASEPLKVEHMGAFSILSLRAEPLEDMRNRFKKRFFDIMFSALTIVFVLSWLYPLLAIIIKMQSPGPVLFKQLRTGRDNKPFWCYKFRSMHINSQAKMQAVPGDSRITAIGKFMRSNSIDEFPQFFNVLIGNMSICGPRPHMLEHTEEYRAIIDQYMVRQFLKPGITGWAQVNGFRGETKQHQQMQRRVEHDIWYMEKWSAMLDVKIIFMTVLNLFTLDANAY